jgi:orotidine-5'-phosphate decarboxylase
MLQELDAAKRGALTTGTEHFGDTVIERARYLGHCFCLGLDPHLELIPKGFEPGHLNAAEPATIEGIEKFLCAVLDLAATKVAAVKPQSAHYERLGSEGIALLERIVAYARSLGVPVLLDAKRGDIAATAQAYADAYLDPASPNPVDALTVNPYMGLDTIDPYFEKSRRHGRGVFVVVKTSNTGSGDFQNLDVAGAPLYTRVATSLRGVCDELRGPSTGWSSVGVVTGSTYPADAARVRTLLPHALLLLPGYGHQSRDLSNIRTAFARGPRTLEGGLISSSRSTLFPETGTSSFKDWQAAFAEQLSADVGLVAASVSI